MKPEGEAAIGAEDEMTARLYYIHAHHSQAQPQTCGSAPVCARYGIGFGYECELGGWLKYDKDPNLVKPLGKPNGPATNTSNIWRRSFASGVKVGRTPSAMLVAAVQHVCSVVVAVATHAHACRHTRVSSCSQHMCVCHNQLMLRRAAPCCTVLRLLGVSPLPSSRHGLTATTLRGHLCMARFT